MSRPSKQQLGFLFNILVSRAIYKIVQHCPTLSTADSRWRPPNRKWKSIWNCWTVNDCLKNFLSRVTWRRGMARHFQTLVDYRISSWRFAKPEMEITFKRQLIVARFQRLSPPPTFSIMPDLVMSLPTLINVVRLPKLTEATKPDV